MEWLVLLTFFVCLCSSMLSGMSGGGGGFITVPYFLFIGLAPAQAIATSKMSGIGTAFGAITAFKGKGLVHKKLVVRLMVIAFVCSIISAFLIPRIDPTLFQNLIGVFLLLMIPTLFINKKALQPGERSKKWISIGYFVYIIFTFLQTLIGTGMGAILVLTLMFLFGLGALEANATKRVAQSIQSGLLFILLSIQGLVVWTHGVAALLGAVIGSHIGTHIAIKKGVRFVKIMLAIVMSVSGIALLLD